LLNSNKSERNALDCNNLSSNKISLWINC